MAAPNEHINSFVEENLEDASKQDNIYCAALAYYKRMCHLYDSNILRCMFKDRIVNSGHKINSVFIKFICYYQVVL